MYKRLRISGWMRVTVTRERRGEKNVNWIDVFSADYIIAPAPDRYLNYRERCSFGRSAVSARESGNRWSESARVRIRQEGE